MRKSTALTFFAATIAAALQAAPASAQPTRVWISGTGNDAGTCPRQAPCKTFAWAHNQVFAGGEITVLDPSGYGTVTITKAVSIVSDSGSGEASVATFAGSAITVNAGASDVVILRGLVIDGLNSATGGIQFNSARRCTSRTASSRMCAARPARGSISRRAATAISSSPTPRS